MPLPVSSLLFRFRTRILPVLIGPPVLAFMPAITLGAFWLWGETELLLLALGLPLVFALGGAFGHGRARAMVPRDRVTGFILRDGFETVIDERFEETAISGLRSACFVLEIGDLRGLNEHHGQGIVDLAMQRWGRVDALVNSAGHGPRAQILEISDEDWHLGMEVYFLSALRPIRLVAPIMEAQGGGAIELLHLFQHISSLDFAERQTETGKTPCVQQALVHHVDLHMARVLADACHGREHLLLRAFQLLAKALAVKHQQPGQATLCVGRAGMACNAGHSTDRRVWCQLADIQHFIQRGECRRNASWHSVFGRLGINGSKGRHGSANVGTQPTDCNVKRHRQSLLPEAGWPCLEELQACCRLVC